MTSIFARLLLAASIGVCAASPAGHKKMRIQHKTVVDASFELLAPEGWSVERKPDGAVLSGPFAEGLTTRVIVRWVRPDHPQYGTPQAYMDNLTKPSSVPMEGWKNGAVETIAASGRKALRLQRDTTEFLPPMAASPKEVPVREEHVAIPAAKGFYLLVYSAPRSLDTGQRPTFRRVVAGFKPKL